MLFSDQLFEGWPWLVLSLVSAYLGYGAVRFIRHRRFYASLPSPSHSFLFGNLKTMGEAMKKYPPGTHPQIIFTNLANEHNFKGLYYLDLYPFSDSFVFITDPALAAQVQFSQFPRHPFTVGYLGGLVGTKSVFSTVGTEWQRQRSWFSPAFSMSHLLTLVPGMIEETLAFKEKMTNYAVSGEVFSMMDATIKLTIDVIARSVGDIKLKSQTEHSEIQEQFAKALDWTAGQTEPILKRILSPFIMRYHTNKLDRLLGGVIKEKYSHVSEDGVNKSILDLALKGYMKSNGRLNDLKNGRADLDKEFMKVALDNAKTFLVAGHDTTSIMITYAFYYLSIYPQLLARVREEHDQVLGTTFDTTIEKITAEPALLNKLSLTLGVLKEVLRLHPVGFTVKAGTPGAKLNFEGRDYPVDRNMMISILVSSMQRDPNLWEKPTEFDPDRWLHVGADANGAWQPFEKGPRNCIGQQLSLLEAKLIAAMTIRYFDFEAAFNPHGLSIPGWGGRAYQELKMTAKPKDGLPMRAKMTSHA